LNKLLLIVDIPLKYPFTALIKGILIFFSGLKNGFTHILKNVNTGMNASIYSQIYYVHIDKYLIFVLYRIAVIQQKQIIFKAFSLSYQVFGEGAETVLCMHGHGRSKDDFLFLEGKGVRVISLDLFFHGKSVIPDERIDKNPVVWKEIQPVFEALLDQENLQKIHILAFSQGGRFALLLLQHLPERILTFTLLAPDGLNNRSFYNWSSRQKIFRMLFHRWQQKPEKLQKLADISAKLKLMRPKVRDFVYHFSSDPDTMLRASQTWMAFRKLQPDPVKIGQIVKKNQLPFRIIMGKYDQVIRPVQALLFLRNASLPENIIEIENGHDFFKPSSVEKFLPHLPFLKRL